MAWIYRPMKWTDFTVFHIVRREFTSTYPHNGDCVGVYDLEKKKKSCVLFQLPTAYLSLATFVAERG